MFCCFGQKRKARPANDNNFNDFPSSMRKLTIQHGQVVTAPSSPGLVSVRNGSKWPTSVYSISSTKRSSQVSNLEKVAEVDFTRPTTTTSSVVAGPPSPTFSFGPSVLSVRSNRSSRYETGSTRRTSIKKPNLETMAEAPWVDGCDDVSASSMRAVSVADGETIFSEFSQADSIPRPPLPVVQSPFNSVSGPVRKASLSAISVAAVGNGPSQTRTVSSERQQVKRFNTAPEFDHAHNHISPDVPGSSKSDSTSAKTPPGTQTTSAINSLPSQAGTSKARKHRPPPITTSNSPPSVPSAFIKGPSTQSSSNGTPSSFRDKALPASPPKTPEFVEDRQQATRAQSVFSVTSSQYSPTPSIHPVNQVQVLQAKQIQQVTSRNTPRLPPTTGTRLADIAAASSPKAVFPPNYSLNGSSTKVNATIAGVVAGFPATPDSYDGPNGPGFTTAPTSAVSPKSVRGASPEVPMTSASLTFPPNLPDYSFTPTKENAPRLPTSRKGSSATVSSELSSLPEVVPGQQLPSANEKSDTPASNVHEMAASGENTLQPATSGHGIAMQLKDFGLKGTATVTISELASMASLEKTRRQAARIERPVS